MMAPDGLRERHLRRFGNSPTLFAAPGRVNIIGEHTDYNDGFVLPIAIDKYTVAARSPLDAPVLHVHSEALNQDASIELDRPFQRRGNWTDYVFGVAAAVNADVPILNGANISIGGDLSLGAGLSSSAALELAIALALYAAAGVDPDPRRLAAVGACAEHEYAGIRSGVMDQLVCALGVAGCALLIDCRSQQTTPVPLPPDLAIAVCDTDVKHALADSAYNERRASCEQGVRLLREQGLEIEALRDLSMAEFARVRGRLPSPIRDCCEHVVCENQRTLEAADALARGNLERVGELVNESHRSLKDLYQVSSPELDHIVDAARTVPGVFGARMTGAGFGGAAIALLRPQAFSELRSTLDREYYRPRSIAHEAYLVKATSGASRIETRSAER